MDNYCFSPKITTGGIFWSYSGSVSTHDPAVKDNPPMVPLLGKRDARPLIHPFSFFVPLYLKGDDRGILLKIENNYQIATWAKAKCCPSF